MSNPEHSARSVTTPDPDALEVVAGAAHEQIEGWIPELASDSAVRDALEKAFDYRGDVTITRKDGTTLEGYLFDRRSGTSLQDSIVRIIPRKRATRLVLPIRYRGARIHRARHRCWQELGSVGTKVLGKEGGR